VAVVDDARLRRLADDGAAEDVRGRRDARQRLRQRALRDAADPLGDPLGRFVGDGQEGRDRLVGVLRGLQARKT